MWIICEDGSMVNTDKVTTFKMEGTQTIAKFEGGGHRIIAAKDVRSDIEAAIRMGAEFAHFAVLPTTTPATTMEVNDYGRA